MFKSVEYFTGQEEECLLTFSSFVVTEMKNALDALINSVLLTVNTYSTVKNVGMQ